MKRAPVYHRTGKDYRLALWAVGFELGLGFIALGIGFVIGHNPFMAPGPARGPGLLALIGVLATLPPLGFFLVFLRSSWKPMREIRAVLIRVLNPLLRHMTVFQSATISLAAGFGEELLFRGLLLGALIPVAGPGWALSASSVVFGVLHWVNRAYAIYATLFGLYLGGLYLLTGSLLVPIVVHALYDGVALMLLARRAMETSGYDN